MRSRFGDKLFYTCQSCRKRAPVAPCGPPQGQPATPSQPRPDMATIKLSQAVARLENGYLGGYAIETMHAALQNIATVTAPDDLGRIDQLLHMGQFEQAMRLAGFDEYATLGNLPLFYDTVSVTGLHAGDPQSINVIPSTATAFRHDGRLLPGQTQDDFVALLRERAGDQVQIDLYQDQFSPAPRIIPRGTHRRDNGLCNRGALWRRRAHSLAMCWID